MSLIYSIECCGGGPLDGHREVYVALPADGGELDYKGHSYCFNLVACKFEYKGHWRHFNLGTSVRLVYRTFGEALRQLGKLQFMGVISASESLEIQAHIKAELRPISVDSKD